MVTIFSLLPIKDYEDLFKIIRKLLPDMLVGIGIGEFNERIRTLNANTRHNQCALQSFQREKKLITFFPSFSVFLFWHSLTTTTSVSEPDGIDNSYQPAGWTNGSYVSGLFENLYVRYRECLIKNMEIFFMVLPSIFSVVIHIQSYLQIYVRISLLTHCGCVPLIP
jgi:hypothetical protein